MIKKYLFKIDNNCYTFGVLHIRRIKNGGYRVEGSWVPLIVFWSISHKKIRLDTTLTLKRARQIAVNWYKKNESYTKLSS